MLRDEGLTKIEFHDLRLRRLDVDLKGLRDGRFTGFCGCPTLRGALLGGFLYQGVTWDTYEAEG